jgi:hypothetical protein
VNSFLWLGPPSEKIECTFSATTQFSGVLILDTLKQNWSSRFSACNVKHRNKPVATYTVFSDTPAADIGFTHAQLFDGIHFLVVEAYGLEMDKQPVNTLDDNIQELGAMYDLSSGCAFKLTLIHLIPPPMRNKVCSIITYKVQAERQLFQENELRAIIDKEKQQDP